MATQTAPITSNQIPQAVPSALQSRVLCNPRLASDLRRKLKVNYEATSTFARLVDALTDEEIIQNYLDHTRAELYNSQQRRKAIVRA